MVEYVKELGDHASTRPIFQRLFLEADDKLAWISNLSIHLYYGSGEGIRSSCVSHVYCRTMLSLPVARASWCPAVHS